MSDTVEATVQLAFGLASQGRLHDAFTLALALVERSPAVYLAQAGCLTLIRRAPESELDVMAEMWLQATRFGNMDNARVIVPELFERADDVYSLSATLSVIEFRRNRFQSAEHMFANCLTGDLPDRLEGIQVREEYAAKSDEYDDNQQHLVSVDDFLAFLEARLRPGSLGRVVDVPCGTGQAASVLRPRADHLTGCDLSAGMLERARATGFYDHLVEGDMLAVLPTLRADMVFAHGSLYYFPDLEPVMAAAAKALPCGGHFAFTDYPAPSGVMASISGNPRYGRSREVVRGVAARHGFLEVDCTLGLTFGLPCLYWLFRKA